MMTKLDTKNDSGGTWINIYKLHDKEIYWCGSVGYSTEEIAQYDNANESYRIATLNIKEVLNQQAEINRLRKALEEIKTVSELLNYDGIACVSDKVLNGEWRK